MKWIALLCLLALAALGGSVFHLLGAGAGAQVAIPGQPAANRPTVDQRRAALLATRQACDLAAMDAFIAQQREALAADTADAAAARLLAEALLERVLLRNMLRGMSVGTPLHSELPAATAADLTEAERLIARARELGDRSVHLLRIEAGVLSNQIVGLGSALRLNSRIEAALRAAAELDPRDPALHVALGVRKLLAPRLLGHDPDGALEHFEYAAEAMPGDERPRVFAAMACWLQRKRERAIQWLEHAVAVNANNVFARAVLRRLQAGEAEPFARDVEAAEAR